MTPPKTCSNADQMSMSNYSVIQLHTERLLLRPLIRGDELPLFEIYSNPEFMRYWSAPPWTSIDQARALIDRDSHEMAMGEHIRLGIIFRDSEKLLGTCSLFNFDVQCRRAELGYGIGQKYWRKGFMTEAVTALLEFCFHNLNLNRIEADIDPRNTASAGGLLKLGFMLEGLLRERWIVDNEVSDTALYGLLLKDWRPRRIDRQY